MQLAIHQTASAPDGRPKRDRWRLADVPQSQSRRIENRGRAWLVFGFIFCPCHLQITIAVLGGVVGGGVLGAAVRDTWTVGTVTVLLYGLTLWRGFAHLRRAKEALPPGQSGWSAAPAAPAAPKPRRCRSRADLGPIENLCACE